MKKFLFKSLGFSFQIFLLLFVLDFVMSEVFRSSKFYVFNSSKEIIEQKIINSDIVIMGNSRAYYQYSPYIFDSILKLDTYNLGFHATPFASGQYAKYLLYRKINKKPRCIIQNVDYRTLEAKGVDYWHVQFYPYFFTSKRKMVFEQESYSIPERYIPMYRYSHFGIFNILHRKDSLYKGYHGEEKIWYRNKSDMIKELYFQYDEKDIETFADFLHDAKEEGIKVIMVYAPIYYEVTEKIANIDRMYIVYDSLSKQYDALILDYTYDEISYDTLLFFDATHLNKKGSELFTTKLCHDIDSLQLLN